MVQMKLENIKISCSLWKDCFECNGVETPSNDQDWITSQKYFTRLYLIEFNF